MADEPQRTMFATTDPKGRRFFWIPDDAVLASGPLLLRSLKGDRKEVDPNTVVRFELDEERAKTVVQQEMAGLARKANQFLTNAATAVRAAATAPPVDPAAQRSAEFNFASVLGMTPEEIRANPEKTIEALKATLTGMTSTLRDAAQTADPVARDVAKKRMEGISAYLRDQGGTEMAGGLESLPERLRTFLSDPDLEKRIREAAASLNQAAAELREGGPQDGGNRSS